MDTPIIPQKQCTRCKEWFPQTTEYFYRSASNKTCGLKAYCKSCGKSDTQKWREENYEEYRAYNAKFAEEHPEYVREQTRKSQAKSYASNPEYHRQKNRDNYHKDVEHSRSVLRNWRKRNPEKVRLYKCNGYEKHGNIIRLYSREWAKRNPIKRRANESKRRANFRNAEGRFFDTDIFDLYRIQNGKCGYCNKELNGKYHIEHMIPLSRGGSNWPSNLKLSCATCNLSKQDRTPEEWIMTKK